MLQTLARHGRRALAAAALALVAAPAAAQIESIDPDSTIDGDLAGSEEQAPAPAPAPSPAATPSASQDEMDPRYRDSVLDLPPEAQQSAPVATAQQEPSDTYGEDDLIGAAEGLFGKGAQGLAGLIEDLLKEQGEPNGYIVGREGGGAFIVGVRYGSGTLHHKIEGNQRVYWTGPSIGIDAGANAGNTFVLVYNLYDTEELFERFPAGEGQVYVVGGFNASYVRKGNIVLIPIRVGAGLRLGVNAGYMKFSKKQKWLPF